MWGHCGVQYCNFLILGPLKQSVQWRLETGPSENIVKHDGQDSTVVSSSSIQASLHSFFAGIWVPTSGHDEATVSGLYSVIHFISSPFEMPRFNIGVSSQPSRTHDLLQIVHAVLVCRFQIVQFLVQILFFGVEGLCFCCQSVHHFLWWCEDEPEGCQHALNERVLRMNASQKLESRTISFLSCDIKYGSGEQSLHLSNTLVDMCFAWQDSDFTRR